MRQSPGKPVGDDCVEGYFRKVCIPRKVHGGDYLSAEQLRRSWQISICTSTKQGGQMSRRRNMSDQDHPQSNSDIAAANPIQPTASTVSDNQIQSDQSQPTPPAPSGVPL